MELLSERVLEDRQVSLSLAWKPVMSREEISAGIAQLEAENAKIAKAAESGIAKAWKRVEILEAENERLRELLRKARNALIWVEDVGPLGEGWQSDKLMTLIGDIEALGGE